MNENTTTAVLEPVESQPVENEPISSTPIQPILQDGLWVDPETGEVVGVAEQPDIEEPLYEKATKGREPGITEAFAEWILRKIRRHVARRRSATMQRQRAEADLRVLIDEAVNKALQTDQALELRMEIEQAEKIERRAGHAVTFFATFYRGQLQEFTLRKLGVSTKRTLDLLGGSISLRKGSSKLEVNDPTAAAKYLLRRKAVDAVTYSVKTSAIPKEILAQVEKGKVPGIRRVTGDERCEIKIDGEKI
jgi:hypothetical protein